MASKILPPVYPAADAGAPLYVDAEKQLRAVDVAGVAAVKVVVFDPDADGAGQPGAKLVTLASLVAGAAHGDLLYVDASGPIPIVVRLGIPADWDDAAKDYVLGIGGGVPAWRILTPPVLAPLGDFSDAFSEDFS